MEIDIAHITNITHETQLLSEVMKKRDVVFCFSCNGSRKIDANQYTMPHPHIYSIIFIRTKEVEKKTALKLNHLTWFKVSETLFFLNNFLVCHIWLPLFFFFSLNL
jgi:hypothetical protein